MIGAIKKALVLAGLRKEPDPGAHDKQRDHRWPAASKAFLIGKVCAGCGRQDSLATHHVKPFHLFPDLEMEPANWIPLCESPLACHFALGHLGNWSEWCPEVREEAAHRRAVIAKWRTP